ncbi:MAG: hypothetical protein ACXAD7_12155 [Candidatus Kariarchaeaceae archaeon]|jgi:hypothetical protein
MSDDIIKKVLASGVCPSCNGEIQTAYGEPVTIFTCQADKTHFQLEVEFHGGEKIIAKLNGKDVSQDELEGIEW